MVVDGSIVVDICHSLLSILSMLFSGVFYVRYKQLEIATAHCVTDLNEKKK
jgi:hypothetical protein